MSSNIARTLSVGALLLVLVGISPRATADTRHVSRGFYAEVGAGPALFLSDAGDYAEIGPALDIRVGYDIFTWLSVGGFVRTSTHEATVPPPPEGEYFQLYHGGAEVRLGYLFGRIGVFVDGQLGLSAISSNVLEKVAILDPDEQFSLSYAAGAGLEYQIQNRHYALGLAGQWMTMADFDAIQGVTARVYLRYTY